MIEDLLNQILSDNSTPRHVRKVCEELMQILRYGEKERLKGLVAYKVEMILEDPNIPMHIRTLLFQLLSKAEDI